MSKSTPTLKSLNLVVKDMDASINFYRTLGIEIPDEILWRTGSGIHHVEIPGHTDIALELDSEQLAENYNAGWSRDSSRCLIGFSVATRECVDEHYGDLVSAGYTGLQPPYDTFWGARYAIVEDPGGNHVGIMSPIDPNLRSEPPSFQA